MTSPPEQPGLHRWFVSGIGIGLGLSIGALLLAASLFADSPGALSRVAASLVTWRNGPARIDLVQIAVPAAQLGLGYTEASAVGDGVRHYNLLALSATGPYVTQDLKRFPGDPMAAQRRFDYEVAHFRSDGGTGEWLEIPSPGPSGSRAFRNGLLGPEAGLYVIAVKGDCVVGVSLGGETGTLGATTTSLAGRVISQILRRIPN